MELSANTPTAAQATDLPADFWIDGKINPIYLPDAKLSTTEFIQPVVSGVLQDIIINKTFLDAYIDARIAASGGGGGTPSLPVPAVPTVTVSGRSLLFTQSTYPNDMEYTVNNGTPVTYTTGNAINVGTDAVPANYYMVRVKATSLHQASSWLGNPAIAAQGGGGGSTSLTPVTTYTNLNQVTASSNNLTFVPFEDQLGYGRAGIIAAGAEFIIQIDGSNIESSGYIGVADNVDQGVYRYTCAVAFRRSGNNEGRIIGVSGGIGFDNFSNSPFTSVPLGRVRGDGTTIFVEKSFDSGTIWTVVDPTKNIAQPAVALYVKAFFDDANFKSIHNIQALNVG